MTDTEILDWLSERGVGGRIASPQMFEGWSIRDTYGMLISEGETLREAVINANGKKC